MTQPKACASFPSCCGFFDGFDYPKHSKKYFFGAGLGRRSRRAAVAMAMRACLLSLLLAVLARQSVAGSATEPDSDPTELFSIEGRVRIPAQGRDARVQVNGGEHIAIPRSDGRFSVQGLEPGSYLLEVVHPLFVYPTLRVDISSKPGSLGKVRAITADAHRRKERVSYPLGLRPLGLREYFTTKKPFNPLNLLRNPMVMMMGAMGLLLLMTKMIDPEELKKAQAEMQKQRAGAPSK